VGFVLGPLIGGLLAGLDTRAPFWGAAALAALNLAAAALFLRESLAPDRRRPVTLARANPLGALRSVARLRAARAPLAVFLILGIAMNVYPAVWAFFGTARFGWDTGMIGVSLALYGISFAAGQALLVGPLIRRFGEHRAAFWGMWVDITTLAALGVVTSGALALLITPFTALGGVVTPAIQAILSRQTPEDAQGELQGVLASLNAIAMIVSPVVMTATFAAFTHQGAAVFAPGAPFLLASAMMVAAMAVHVAGGRAAVPARP
jgi:DHA1 family tetracycline resistance protein-like MFS transporter